MKILYIIALLFIMCPTLLAQTFLLGDPSGDSSGSFGNKWKCVQYEARNSGITDEGRVQFHSVSSGQISIDMGFAVYSDNGNDFPEDLLSSGCLIGVNPTYFNQGHWIVFGLTDGWIQDGSLYWSCFIDDSSNNFWVYRANDPPANTYPKLIYTPDVVNPCSPPSGSEMALAGRVSGGYNFAVYEVDTSSDPCFGDFDCDGDVDGSDIFLIKQSFGRGDIYDPCPTTNDQPYCD